MSTEFITDVIDVPQLVGYVRERHDGGRPFEPWSPARAVGDIEYELQNIDTTGALPLARYRSWEAAPVLGRRPGISIIGGEIPPLGLSFRLGEKDIIRLQKLRAAVGDATDARVVDTIFNDADNAVAGVNNRITWAQAELFRTGAVTIEGGVSGAAVNATFAVPGGHLGVVPAGALWSVPSTAVPLTDMAAWQKTLRAANGGRNPDVWISSSDVINDLTLNAQIRGSIPANADGGIAGFITPSTVTQVLANRGLAPIVAVDLELPQLSDGTLARVIPARSMIAIYFDRTSETLFGPSPNAAVLAGQGQLAFSEASGLIAYVEQSLRPASIMTTGEAVAIPVLKDPKALFSASV